jgi:O-antigen/teichoic acid export membrane protein
MKIAESHVARAAIASTWNYSARLLGLGWTALLISKLGIGDYGQYAIGIAGAAITNAAIDNAFYVRSLRIDEDRYQRERCARVLFGTVIAVIGVACFFEWYVVGFAILVGAGELFFNTFKSQYLRVSRPDIANRYDAIRQPTSIGLGAAYLFLAHDPHLGVATALYVVPYGVIMLVCFAYVPGRRPAIPGDWREIALLSSEAFAAAMYAQGDLLVLGLLAGNKVTGYYSVALVTATAVATIGQNYASTFIEHLRATNGALTSAPPISHILRVGMITGGAMAAIGFGILIWGGADMVGVIFLIMSLWVFGRAIEYNFIVILFVQRRDVLRVRATAAVAVLKVCLLFPGVYLFGAYGAAVAGVFCELGLVTFYYRKIYAPGRKLEGSTDSEALHQ